MGLFLIHVMCLKASKLKFIWELPTKEYIPWYYFHIYMRFFQLLFLLKFKIHWWFIINNFEITNCSDILSLIILLYELRLTWIQNELSSKFWLVIFHIKFAASFEPLMLSNHDLDFVLYILKNIFLEWPFKNLMPSLNSIKL